jgi:TetR/AcrR family transcriptional regulator, transcriptional repressor for nem operon
MARVKEFDEKETLTKALEIFWSKGYNGTSMQDLIDGLGISRSSLYDTYGDKRALFLSVLEYYRKTQSEAMISMIEQSTDIVQSLREMLYQTLTSCPADKVKNGCILVNTAVEMAPHDIEINEMIAGNQKDVEQIIYKAILKGQQKGQVTKQHNAKTLSKFILNTFTGLRVSVKTNPDKKAIGEIINVALSVL